MKLEILCALTTCLGSTNPQALSCLVLSCRVNRERRNIQRLPIRPKRVAFRRLLTEHFKSLPKPGEHIWMVL